MAIVFPSIAMRIFICEYVGELLHDAEGNDEHHFDIGHNCNDESMSEGCQNYSLICTQAHANLLSMLATQLMFSAIIM